MAERRMFAKTIIDSDAFIDMPVSARLLYYDLGMRADDDGFVNSPKKIQRIIGSSDDDFKILITKNFIIPFESGVIVIKHWKLHNYIQKDRYKETVYHEEKAMLEVKENGVYTKCIQNVSNEYTQVRIGKSKSKESEEIGEIGADCNNVQEFNNFNNNEKQEKGSKKKYLEFVFLNIEEHNKLIKQFGELKTKQYIENLNNYIGSKGTKYKSHYHTILAWSRKEDSKKTSDNPYGKPEVF